MASKQLRLKRGDTFEFKGERVKVLQSKGVRVQLIPEGKGAAEAALEVAKKGTKTCPECKTEFKPKSHNHRYCKKECREAAKEQKGEVVGNQESDNLDAVDKREVLALIQSEIDLLEEREVKLMNKGIFEEEDAFSELEEPIKDSCSANAHIAITVEITTLKKLLKKVENL